MHTATEQAPHRVGTTAPSPHNAKNVIAGLSYLQPTTERPCSYAYEPPSGVPWENCAYEQRTMPINDARQAAQRADIDREGYALWDAPTAVKDFYDAEAIKAIYYPEARELALSATGASRAYVFDHLVRKREPDRAALSFGRASAKGPVATNGRIHNDYTESSGLRRLGLVLPYPEEAPHVRRFAIVNIWRSIKGPVLDTPLAVCDARTVMARDLVCSEVRYPRRTGEIYVALHSPLHRWSYYSEMDRHEALVFKQYDSQISGVARFTPHAAFDLPKPPPEAPLRESIELRCLVVYGDDGVHTP
ncbi:MAG: CmcJ/NvfI family oxidoreductase [Pseudomonadota bacterium]